MKKQKKKQIKNEYVNKFFFTILRRPIAVSYTHLDVYKRQGKAKIIIQTTHK